MSKEKGFKLTKHPLSSPYERDRGLFTPGTDRPFLINHDGESPSDRAAYKRQVDIRERLYNGIVDFQLASNHIGKWNWRKFLDFENAVERRDLRRGMIGAMALFYEIHHEMGWGFEGTLRRAIETAYTTGAKERTIPKKFVDNVDLEIELSEPEEFGMEMEHVSRKLVEGAELTDREVHFAVKQGWFDKLEEHYTEEVE